MEEPGLESRAVLGPIPFPRETTRIESHAMPLLLQHLLVLLLVGLCLVWVGWQAFASLTGKRSRVGSCCAKGCTSAATAASAPAGRRPAERVDFIPVEMLSRRK